MRAKEFKQMINKLPDDAEIVIRAQTHKGAKSGYVDSMAISSANLRLDEYSKMLILNPVKPLRTVVWVPKPTDLVDCVSCKHYATLENCRLRGRSCSNCSANCNCDRCNPSNPTMACPFSERPSWEGREML